MGVAVCVCVCVRVGGCSLQVTRTAINYGRDKRACLTVSWSCFTIANIFIRNTEETVHEKTASYAEF